MSSPSKNPGFLGSGFVQVVLILLVLGLAGATAMQVLQTRLLYRRVVRVEAAQMELLRRVDALADAAHNDGPSSPAVATGAAAAAQDAAAAASLAPNAAAVPDAPDTGALLGGDAIARDDVRALLAEELARSFPDLELSEAELDELTTAVVTMRAAQDELRALPFTGENAARIRALRSQVIAQADTFRRVTHMSTGDFIQAVSQSGGIDNDRADTGAVVLEPLPPP